jgi:hypothetical protein
VFSAADPLAFVSLRNELAMLALLKNLIWGRIIRYTLAECFNISGCSQPHLPGVRMGSVDPEEDQRKDRAAVAHAPNFHFRCGLLYRIGTSS